MPLVVVGHGDEKLVTYGEFKGVVSNEERNHILAHATAVLMPTQYLEPFGNVTAEAQLCGTPVISTDYGAFVETVEQGVSGYRCCTLGEFVQAIDWAKDLDRAAIRRRAVAMFGEDAAAVSYDAYFRRLHDLQMGTGWYSLQATLPTKFAPVVLDEMAVA
jgi:glycosyltransferase involved in cell wall biosynthesis